MIGKLKMFALGIIVGVFVAPRSGRVSRDMVIGWVSDFLDLGEGRLEVLETELAERRDFPDEETA